VNKTPRQPVKAQDSEQVDEEEPQNEDDTWEVAGRGKKSQRRPPVVRQVQPVPTKVTEELENLTLEGNSDGTPSASDMADVLEETSGVPDDVEVQVVGDDDEDEDSDAGEWITPENVVQVKAAELGHKGEGKSNKYQIMQVACITADFAMQVR
jgi:hypothetical protein